MKAKKQILGLCFIVLLSTISLTMVNSSAESRSAVDLHVDWTTYNSYSNGNLGDGTGWFNAAELKMKVDYYVGGVNIADRMTDQVKIDPGEGEGTADENTLVETCAYPSDVDNAYAKLYMREYDGSSYTTLFWFYVYFPNNGGYQYNYEFNYNYEGTTFYFETWIYYIFGQVVGCN